MEWSTILILVIAAVVVLFPVAFIWYMCIGGICVAFKSRAVKSTLTCSIDDDCPDGYICVNGRCIPQGA